MKKWTVMILLLAATGCTTPAPQYAASSGALDPLVPIARRKAMELFGKKEQELWFHGMQCRYCKDWPEQDSTNALRWYTFTFIDAKSVQSDSDGTHGVTAMSYSISLTTNGEYTRSSSGRGIGWSQ
jgi:hypothetical protein